MPARAACLALAFTFLLLAPVALAQTEPAPRPGSVWTVLTTVEAVVEGNYAVVKVIADIGNRGPDPEFPFLVQVPDDAFVTGLTIERDGKVYEARIEDREAARTEYDTWKRQEQTGGLVEKRRHSSAYAYLINVAEFTNVRATLTYERYLAAERGIHNLSLEAPVSGFGEDLGARFRVTVRDAASAWGAPDGLVQRTDGGFVVTREVGPRPSDAATPFQVSYSLAPTPDAGELLTRVHNGTGYFVHRLRAPADERTMPVDLVLVLDISGSMSGLKMQQMQDAAVQVLQHLGPEDRLHLAFFSSDSSASWKGLRAMDAAGRLAAAQEVRSALVAGGTNLEAAITAGFGALQGVDWAREEGRLPAIVLLTDGQPTAGTTDRESLRRLARDANRHDVNVFAIAFGSDADWSFIHGIAADADGIALRVPEGAGAEVDIRRFMQSLTTPVLKDVRVLYPAHVNASRTGADVLFAGSELLIVGRFDPARGPMHARVTATAPDGARTFDVTSREGDALAFLPRVVAYHDIRRLQDLSDAEGARSEWTAEIRRLALRHGFVTDHTSLVVTLEPRNGPVSSCANCSVTVADAAESFGTSGRGTAQSAYALTTADPGAKTGAAATSAVTPSPATSPPPAGARAEPSAQVPNAGALLVGLALVAGALLAGRRR